MSDIFKKALSLITGSPVTSDTLKMPKNRPFKKLTERDLLSLESQIGASLFGPIPEGHRREFFCLDDVTWIWHEEWKDEKGTPHATTTRYEVHDKGILKVQEGARYKYIEGEELENIVVATRMYYEQVARKVYNRDPATGKKLS
jgi:hypothetical protein